MLTLRDHFCLGRKYLVYNLVARNLKVKYRRSFLGAFWTLLVPVSLAIVYYVVFGQILQVKLPHYLAHMFAGVLAWTFFASSVSESIESLIQNQALISKIPVQVQVFPWVTTLTNAVALAVALPVIAITFWISGVEIRWPALAAIPLALALLLCVYGISLLISIGAVFFRDIKHGMSILLQLWLYATPVFYDQSLVPDRFRFVFYLNPLASIWSCFHDALLKAQWPTPTMAAVAGAWTVVVTTLGYLVVRGAGPRVAEAL